MYPLKSRQQILRLKSAARLLVFYLIVKVLFVISAVPVQQPIPAFAAALAFMVAFYLLVSIAAWIFQEGPLQFNYPIQPFEWLIALGACLVLTIFLTADLMQKIDALLDGVPV